MTPEQIHDALTLLPSDLIAEVDKKRSGKPKVIVWKRYAAMAASFALVLCCGLFCMTHFVGLGGSKETAAVMEAAEKAAADFETIAAAVEAPAAEYEEATPEAAEETLCALPAESAKDNSNTTMSGNSDLCTDHAHSPAERREEGATGAIGGCGNTTATLYYGESVFQLSGSGAITLSYILDNLEYDPANLCRCRPEITIDTEMGTGYEISLTEYFVRFEGGQAALTSEQAAQLKQAIEESLPIVDEMSYSTHQVITPSLDSYHSDHSVTLITSRGELEGYWETFVDRYDFSSMKSICDLYGYDDAWFEENDLLLNVVFSHVGVTYDVTSIINAGSNHDWEWEVLVSLKGEYYPDNEEATYHLLTRLKKGVMSSDDDIIGVMDTRGMEHYLEE